MTDPWGDLQELWHRDAPDAPKLVRQVRRLERTRLWSRLLRLGVVALGLSGLAAAVAHSVTLVEAGAALVIATTIVAYFGWVTRDEARHYEMLSRDSTSYLRSRQVQLKSELRTITFTWVIIGVELSFFVPWLIDGIPLHFGSFWSPAVVFAWWIPLLGMALLLAITVRAAIRRRRELDQVNGLLVKEDLVP